MVLQLVISLAERMEVIVDATACLWSMVTACALGPVPIKQTIEMFARDCVRPKLAQMWVLWIELFGSTRRTAAWTSSTSALSCLLIVVDKVSASVNVVMFLFDLLFPARLLRCWAQELVRIDIFVSVLVDALVALSMLSSMSSCGQCSCCVGDALVNVCSIHVMNCHIIDALVLIFVALVALLRRIFCL